MLLMQTNRIVYCPYCQQQAVLKKGSEIFNNFHHKNYYWVCFPCNARVGVNRVDRDFQPLGRLANKELRVARLDAHDAFDKLWKSGLMERSEAYTWLSRKMKISREYCHIGFFDLNQCKQVVDVINDLRKLLPDIIEWDKEYDPAA